MKRGTWFCGGWRNRQAPCLYLEQDAWGWLGHWSWVPLLRVAASALTPAIHRGMGRVGTQKIQWGKWILFSLWCRSPLGVWDNLGSSASRAWCAERHPWCGFRGRFRGMNCQTLMLTDKFMHYDNRMKRFVVIGKAWSLPKWLPVCHPWAGQQSYKRRERRNHTTIHSARIKCSKENRVY